MDTVLRSFLSGLPARVLHPMVGAAMLLCAAAAPAGAQETADIAPFEIEGNPGDIDDETGWRGLADELGFAPLQPDAIGRPGGQRGPGAG